MKIQLPLTGNAQLPERAGMVTLKPTRGATPVRFGHTIQVPVINKGSFTTLLNGEQFVVVVGAGDQAQGSFGGTDEQPFLTGLLEPAWRALEEGGEKAFYESLKPTLIQKLEAATGVPSSRQGDILAHRLDRDWQDITRFATQGTPMTARDRALFGTNHLFTGEVARIQLFPDGSEGTTQLVVVGTITAPDHRPLILNTPHVITRAQYVTNPLC